MNKHLESFHIDELIVITESTNLFETHMGRLKAKFIV